MDKSEILDFLRSHKLAAQSSVSQTMDPQAAIVGYAVTENFEIIFDTLEDTRKIQNLRMNPGIALVIGGFTQGDERSVQCYGIADEPKDTELSRLKQTYFDVFADGRERQNWQGITYVRVKPHWISYCDYAEDPPRALEFTFNAI